MPRLKAASWCLFEANDDAMLAHNCSGPCGQPLLQRLEVLGNVVIISPILVLTSARSKLFPIARFGCCFDVNVKSYLADRRKCQKKKREKKSRRFLSGLLRPSPGCSSSRSCHTSISSPHGRRLSTENSDASIGSIVAPGPFHR